LSIETHPALQLFAELLAVPSPSGREERLAKLLCEKIAALGDTPRLDAAGNVLVHVPGRYPQAPLCCLSAHMDEIALVVTRIEPDGALLVDRSGGLLPWKLGEGPVQILGDERDIVGVVSMGSAHVAAGDRAITWKDVRVLTGLTPAQLGEAGIRPGSTAVPIAARRGPVVLGEGDDPLIGAWTFDDRMGVVALLRLLETLHREGIQPYHPTLFAFTVREEGEGQGVKTMAMRERPEVFIGIDGCPMPPGAPLLLDGRPGIWSKDRLGHYDQWLVRDLCQAAKRAGTELQPVVYDNAASDASMVYQVGAAMRVACLGQVRENSHGYEVARLSVFDNLLKTLVQFVAGWEG
jgi:putative aminopeptidase FrvX